MTTNKATSEPAYSDYQALRASERAVLDACVEQSKALDDVRARPGQLSALQRHTDAVRSLSIKVRSYRALIEALIEAESK